LDNSAIIIQKPYVITEIVHATPDVDIFRMAAQDGTRLNFDPGMFVMLNYVNNETGEKIARAFSIASAPNSEVLDFFVHMIHGRFTSKLDTAKVGDIYYVSGPYGQFKFDAKSDKKVLFIAGGTGIAPFMSMLKHIRNISSGNDVILIYSIRYPNEIIAKEDLESLEKEINLKMVITVTRPQQGDGWSGETGHIDSNMLNRHVSDIMERSIYICGPLSFTKAMKEVVASMGVKPEKVKADVWG
jgi:Na+-transporting NADH:ubiquinone oxidoreductase subunit F